MEAETYLTSGYGMRIAIEAKPCGWVRFEELADVTAPPRIKQILVSPQHGTPYLNTSQVFDLRPKPRKWLAESKTTKVQSRFVTEGTILVMASATVGRAIVATKTHEKSIISHHFMRVSPKQRDLAGWIYAFIRSPQGQAMIRGSQYASVIRHVEPEHMKALPVPLVSSDVAADFQTRVDEIIACRNNAASLQDAAEKLFADTVGPMSPSGADEGFTVKASSLAAGRRRFEAAHHSPNVESILRRFATVTPLGELVVRVWWGNRFKRHFGEGGISYLSADDVFTMNPYELQKILVDDNDWHQKYFVRAGWLVMACSGQVYGLNGAATIATEWHENTVFSHDMIRIEPREEVRAGYLLTALTHPTLGRPLLLREAYGMSVPHLDPGDVARFPVVRLDESVENKVADLAEEATRERARAEVLERELSEAAGKVISDFLLRASSPEDVEDVETARKRLAEIDARPESLIQGVALEARLSRIKT